MFEGIIFSIETISALIVGIIAAVIINLVRVDGLRERINDLESRIDKIEKPRYK